MASRASRTTTALLFSYLVFSGFIVDAHAVNFSVGCPSSESFEAERGFPAYPFIGVLGYDFSQTDSYVDVSLSVSGLPPGVSPQWDSGPIFRVTSDHSMSGGIVLRLNIGDDTPLGDFPVTLSGTALNGPLSGQSRTCQFTLSVKQLEKFITIELSTSSIQAYQSVTIHGLVGYHVNPPNLGIANPFYVQIQQLKGSSWETIGTSELGKSDDYSYTWSPSEAGSYQLRAQWLVRDLNGPERVLATSDTVMMSVSAGIVGVPWPVYLLVATVVLIGIIAFAKRLRRKSQVSALGRSPSLNICPNCGFQNPPYASAYCVKCGNPLGH